MSSRASLAVLVSLARGGEGVAERELCLSERSSSSRASKSSSRFVSLEGGGGRGSGEGGE